jgi:hypothetical protein
MVNVGEPAIAIPVNKDIICSAAPYFNNYFNGPFMEGGSKTMSLPDVAEGSFRIFLRWAYARVTAQERLGSPPRDMCQKTDVNNNSDKPTQSMRETTTNSRSNSSRASGGRKRLWWEKPCPAGYDGFDLNDSHCCARYRDKSLSHDEPDARLSKDTAEIDSILFPLLELYIFADKYSVHQLRDDILTALFYNMIDWEAAPAVSPDITNLAYDKLPPSSPFLRYLVHSQAYFGRVSELDRPAIDGLRDHHPDYIFDLMMAQSLRIDNYNDDKKGIAFHDRVGMANSCVFHEHLVFCMADCRKRMRDGDHIFLDLINGCRSILAGFKVD